MSEEQQCSSPKDNQPTSPGFQDPGRNVAVDYIKARYEGGAKPKESPAVNVPKVFREPKKLDFQWDKVVDESAKKETGLPVGFKEQDLLQMVFTLTGVDTKSQYLSAIDSQQSVSKDETSKAEIESLPEITKSVRKMFESGKVASSSEKSSAETVEEIQRGTAKSLLSQWTRIETDGTTTTSSGPPGLKPTYEISAGSGVFENEPATLDGVVRSTDQAEEQVIERGLTRSLLGQWKNMGNDTSKQFKNGPVRVKPTYESAPGSGVFENEPTRLDGVVRENDEPGEGEQIQRGFTKSLLSKWQNKGNEEQKYPSKRIIQVAEAEGRVAENEPVRRTDVVRADDIVPEGEQIKKGLAKSLVSEWKTKGKEEFVVQKKVINVAEAEGKVLENEPIRRNDVVREDDPASAEGEQIQRGTTRMLLDQWKNIGSNTRQYSSKERTPVVVAETEGQVVENEPAPRRTDVAREDDPGNLEGERIQRGLARSLMNQWKSIGSMEAVDRRKERTPINVNEAEGKVLENEPVRRTDVVRADDENFEEIKIQRGTTRNLLSQWKNKSNEEFRSVRKSIILNEDEGRVAENEPEAQRSDVVRENGAEEERVERGFAKSRLNQWQSKATEQFKAERKSIVLAEAEGCVAENEPVKRTDVVREDDQVDENGEKIQRGITKSLLSQWKTMGTEDTNKQSRKTIIVAEGDDCVAENEPVKRTDVVNADSTAPGDEIQVKRGITKSLLNQWKTKGTEEVRIERKPIVVAEDDGRVLESEPVKLEGVIRADDSADADVVQRGTTRSLLEQWKNKPNEESKIERRPIVLAEAEGTVAENEPAAQRQDVVRSSEYVPEERVVARGFARNLRQQWTNKSEEEFRKERTPIVLNEADGRIVENEPVRRTDVVRSDDINGAEGETLIQRGMTKSLLNRWSGANFDTEMQPQMRKPIVIAEDEGRILENEPVRRDDVVRADSNVDNEVLVRRGLAKSLVNEWKNKGSEDFVVEKKVINICEGEGTVAENEPVKRTDVVREDDDVLQEQERIQKGLTRSLLGQWKKIGTEDTKIERKPIILAEGEGTIAESEPIRRDDVVRCDDVDSSGEIISKGITRSLLTQWSNKGNEEFVTERKVINIAEGEGKVVENEPVIRTDVVRESCEYETVNIQRGMAKSLVNQWKHKGEEEVVIEKKPIIVAEAEGKVVENEPTVRSDLIRESDNLEDIKIQRGLAKSMVSQWKHKGEESEFKVERAPIVLTEDEGTVAESEPVRRDDVVRADDFYTEGETIQRGMTKSLLSQWKTKGSEEYMPQRKSIIIAEGEGTVAENEPIRRQDVVREDDPAFQSSAELPQRGQARQLRAQWVSLGTEALSSNSSRDATPKPMINIYEEAASAAGSAVIENQPAPRRADVVREDDETPGDAVVVLRRGHARDMVSQWTSSRSDNGQTLMSKERMELEALRKSGVWATGTDVDGAVFENQPLRLDGVVRSDDPVEDQILIERGTAKQLASSWLNRQDDTGNRQPFRLELDLDPNAVSVYENEPVQLEGVVKSSEAVDEVLGLQGQIRNIAHKFVAAEDDLSQQKKIPEMVKIDLADGPSVLENNPAPVDPSIVRSDDYEPDMLKAGLTRNMLEKWQSQRDLEGATGAGTGIGGKPSWQIELEMTPAGSGVFENEPIVRTDVIREEDHDPDFIPVRQTRKTRMLWSRREREEIEGPTRVDSRTREMVRFTPPRERTPPIVALDEPYKSVQRITLQSSGSSTPARDQTPGRSSAASQSAGRGSHAASAVQSPHQSQPGTPSATAAASWAPSPAEAARARAQISNEVMQWHARRMSRSISVDESQSNPTPTMTPTTTFDPTAEWINYQQQQQLLQHQQQQQQQQQPQQSSVDWINYQQQQQLLQHQQQQQQQQQPQQQQPQQSSVDWINYQQQQQLLQHQQQQQQQQQPQQQQSSVDWINYQQQQQQQQQQQSLAFQQTQNHYNGSAENDSIFNDQKFYQQSDVNFYGNNHQNDVNSRTDGAYLTSDYHQQQQQYYDDANRWTSYEASTPDLYQYNASYLANQQQQPPLSPLSPASDDYQYPVTVKSSATVVFRPASNGQ